MNNVVSICEVGVSEQKNLKIIDEFITGPLLDALLRTKLDDTTRNLSNIRDKNRGLLVGLPELCTAAEIQHETSKMATEQLTKTIKGREELCSIIGATLST